MATPLFSVGGLASGLDTTSIISQLMQLERQPVVRFQQRQAELRKVDDAWGTVTTKLSSFRTALDALAKPGALAGLFTATSSRAEAVGVAVGGQGSAVAGSTSLTVERLATAHQLQAGGTFASAQELVGEGTFRLLAADGTEVANVATTAATTLEQLAAAVNAAGTGVSAQVLKVTEGDHRLVVTSRETGAADAFTVDAAPPALAGSTVLTQAVDARVLVGGLAVERSSNVIDDLVAGTTLTLKQVSAEPVIIVVGQDLDAAVGKVKAMVDALNGALATLRDLTKYDATSKTAGVLQGDPTARRIAADLRNAFGTAFAEGTAAGIGITFDRYGVAALDETKLRAALTDDIAGVQRVLDRGVTATTGLRAVSVPAGLAEGTYDVAVTALATAASGTGTVYRSAGASHTITITTSGRQVDVAIPATSTLAQALTAINDTLRNAGVDTLTAADVGGAIHLQESRVGSAHGFSVSATTTRFGVGGSYAGADAQGTIAGVAATGSGNSLTGANGLVIQALAVTTGSVTVADGLTGVVDVALDRYEGADSFISRARSTLTGEIRRLDDRIADFGVRLDQREKTLRMKFAALETALARSSSQGAWLAGQLGISQQG